MDVDLALGSGCLAQLRVEGFSLRLVMTDGCSRDGDSMACSAICRQDKAHILYST
jgi:hypothetical protein